MADEYRVLVDGKEVVKGNFMTTIRTNIQYQKGKNGIAEHDIVWECSDGTTLTETKKGDRTCFDK